MPYHQLIFKYGPLKTTEFSTDEIFKQQFYRKLSDLDVTYGCRIAFVMPDSDNNLVDALNREIKNAQQNRQLIAVAESGVNLLHQNTWKLQKIVPQQWQLTHPKMEMEMDLSNVLLETNVDSKSLNAYYEFTILKTLSQIHEALKKKYPLLTNATSENEKKQVLNLIQMIHEWANDKFSDENNIKQEQKFKDDPIYKQKVLFQQRLAYEIIQLLEDLEFDKSQHIDKTHRHFGQWQKKLENIIQTCSLYATTVDSKQYALNSRLTKVILPQLAGIFKIASPLDDETALCNRKLWCVFGRIADKLVQHRQGDLGQQDLLYAMHFARLIQVIASRDRNQFITWGDEAPANFSHKYASAVHELRFEMFENNVQNVAALIPIYHIVRDLVLEHPLMTNQAASFEQIEQQVPAVSFSPSSTGQQVRGSIRHNHTARFGVEYKNDNNRCVLQ